jgi:hypothetical protein
MLTQEAKLFGLKVQDSFEEVDQALDDALLEKGLGNREIVRTLGSFGFKDYSGVAHLLDDDSVFTLWHIGRKEIVDEEEAQETLPRRPLGQRALFGVSVAKYGVPMADKLAGATSNNEPSEEAVGALAEVA